MNLIPGRYACEVLAPENGWFGEAGDKNTPFIRIPLVVTKGKFTDEEVTFQAWINDKSFQRTMKNLRDVFPDWDGDLVALAKLTDSGPFAGCPCSIVVEEEEYKGKMRPKIAWLNGPDSGDKSMDVNRALELAARLQGVKHETPKATPAGYGARRPVTPPKKEPDHNEPDIPWE